MFQRSNLTITPLSLCSGWATDKTFEGNSSVPLLCISVSYMCTEYSKSNIYCNYNYFTSLGQEGWDLWLVTWNIIITRQGHLFFLWRRGHHQSLFLFATQKNNTKQTKTYLPASSNPVLGPPAPHTRLNFYRRVTLARLPATEGHRPSEELDFSLAEGPSLLGLSKTAATLSLALLCFCSQCACHRQTSDTVTHSSLPPAALGLHAGKAFVFLTEVPPELRTVPGK